LFINFAHENLISKYIQEIRPLTKVKGNIQNQF